MFVAIALIGGNVACRLEDCVDIVRSILYICNTICFLERNAAICKFSRHTLGR